MTARLRLVTAESHPVPERLHLVDNREPSLIESDDAFVELLAAQLITPFRILAEGAFARPPWSAT